MKNAVSPSLHQQRRGAAAVAAAVVEAQRLGIRINVAVTDPSAR